MDHHKHPVRPPNNRTASMNIANGSDFPLESLTRWQRRLSRVTSTRPVDNGEGHGQKMSEVLDLVRGSTFTEQTQGHEYGGRYLDAERLLTKLDSHLLAPLFLMALMHGFDKNVSHARTMGMNVQVQITDDEWSALLMTYFLGFIASTVAIISLAQHGGRWILTWLTVVTVTTGFTTASNALTTEFHEGRAYAWVIVTRLIQGICEGSFSAMMATYLLQFYTAADLAPRMLLFFLVPSLSSALGALWAFGAINLPRGILYDWQWFFIGEGGITVILGVIGHLVLPSCPAEATWYTKDKSAAQSRMSPTQGQFIREELSVHGVAQLAKHPAAISWMLVDLSLGVPMTIVTLYLPQIILRIGFSTKLANLLTCFPYFTAILFLLLVVRKSNSNHRLHWFAGIFIVQLAGFLLYRLTVSRVGRVYQGLAYFSTFLMATGVGTTNVLAAKHFGPMIEGNSQRLFLNTIGVCLINLGGILMSWLFRTTQFRADNTAVVFAGFGLLVCYCGIFWVQRTAMLPANPTNLTRKSQNAASAEEKEGNPSTENSSTI